MLLRRLTNHLEDKSWTCNIQSICVWYLVIVTVQQKLANGDFI